MADILSNCGVFNPNIAVSFLIVATGDLNERIFFGLKFAAEAQKYRINIHRCESILDVTELKPNLNVDIIIIAFDGRIQNILNEVENNIKYLDEIFIILSRIFIVNCYGSPNTMGLTSHSANQICEKYNLQLLSTNTHDNQAIQDLGKRILNLTESLMGFNTGIPDLNIFNTSSKQ